jgi:hypothetical protein
MAIYIEIPVWENHSRKQQKKIRMIVWFVGVYWQYLNDENIIREVPLRMLDDQNDIHIKQGGWEESLFWILKDPFTVDYNDETQTVHQFPKVVGTVQEVTRKRNKVW